MIRHAVLFKFTPDFPAEQRAAWTAGLDRMRGNVPGLLALTHGPDVIRSERAFDYAIVADFASVADIEVYNTHPLHEPLKKYSFPNSEQIISVDFEIPKDTP
ncbi:Dabb family protein [Sinomonas sp. ASV486]|uniref:Dabb family protein n=1 Tax=Sinomonas puerhi TaxID=3238584 RepID=A0AB39L7U2_9MICC|nr:Dabb family protein [Sinomonas sp. ASV486]MDQ4491924.1 Dabb family protein [Sinomonas sp. ASV486]